MGFFDCPRNKETSMSKLTAMVFAPISVASTFMFKHADAVRGSYPYAPQKILSDMFWIGGGYYVALLFGIGLPLAFLLGCFSPDRRALSLENRFYLFTAGMVLAAIGFLAWMGSHPASGLSVVPIVVEAFSIVIVSSTAYFRWPERRVP